MHEDHLGVTWNDREPGADALGSRSPTGDNEVSPGVHLGIGESIGRDDEHDAVHTRPRGGRRPLDYEAPGERCELLLPAKASTVTCGDDYRPDRAQECALLG
jgi:hypothetical protein